VTQPWDPWESETPVLELDARPHRGTVDYPGGQVAMIRGCLKYPIFVNPCGRRVGKTTAIFFLWLEEQARRRGFYNSGYVATDHPKAKEFFEVFFKCMGGDPKHNPESLIKSFNRSQGQDRWIELHALTFIDPDTGEEHQWNTGGKYYFWSGQHPNYEAIQGFMFPFHRMCVDEMQLQHEALVTDILMPMLGDEDGKLLLTGHPKRGRPGNHLFQTYFNRGKSERHKWREYGCWNIPAEGNPYTPRNAIERGRNACLTKEQEREEYDGLFCDDTGGVFPNLNLVFDVEPTPRETPDWYRTLQREHPMPGAKAWFAERPVRGKKYVIGVDWGKLMDATVFSIFDRTTNRQVAVFQIQGEDYDDQIRWLHTIRKKYNNAVVHGDQNGVGEAMGEQLRKRYKSGYKGHKFNAANKELYVRRGQIHFKEVWVHLMNIEDQREEFRLFSIIPPKTDDLMGGKHINTRYGHPPNEHDDFVDAFLVLTESLMLNPKKRREEKRIPPSKIPGTLAYVLEQQRRREAAKTFMQIRIG